jgi:hypothetical protein
MAADIYILRSGAENETGPFTLEEVREMRYGGQLAAEDFFWKPGMAEWAPITNLPRAADASAAVIRLPGERQRRPMAWERAPRMLEIRQERGVDAGAVVGLVGAGMLIVGPFCPLLRVPILGSITYFNSGRGDGIIVLVCGLLAMLLAFLGARRALWLAGLVPIGLMIYFVTAVSGALSDAKSEFEGDSMMMAGLVRTFLSAIQIEWGAAVILLGALLCIIASAMPAVRRRGGW